MSKELEQRIEALEADNAVLKAQVETLEAEVNKAREASGNVAPKEEKPVTVKVGRDTYEAKVKQIKEVKDGLVTHDLATASAETLKDLVERFPQKFKKV